MRGALDGSKTSSKRASTTTDTTAPLTSSDLNSTLNRVALMAEAMVHSDCRELLDAIHTKPEGANIPPYLDAGPKAIRNKLYDTLAKKCNEIVRFKVSNLFKMEDVSTPEARQEGNDAWLQIRDIHPEHGVFRDGEEFRTLETTYCNWFSTLQQNLSLSGSYTGGEHLFFYFNIFYVY